MTDCDFQPVCAVTLTFQQQSLISKDIIMETTTRIDSSSWKTLIVTLKSASSFQASDEWDSRFRTITALCYRNITPTIAHPVSTAMIKPSLFYTRNHYNIMQCPHYVQDHASNRVHSFHLLWDVSKLLCRPLHCILAAICKCRHTTV